MPRFLFICGALGEVRMEQRRNSCLGSCGLKLETQSFTKYSAYSVSMKCCPCWAGIFSTAIPGAAADGLKSWHSMV